MQKLINENWLSKTLRQITSTRVAVFGDFCLDAYWTVDPETAECSVETGLPVRRICEQRYNLGGAGNVAANLAALKVAEIQTVGLIGNDMFAWQMRRLFSEFGIDTSDLMDSQSDWRTFCYAKPYIRATEQNRIDFGSFNEPSAGSIEALGERLNRVAKNTDVIILNQQLATGVSTPAMIERINEIVRHNPQCRFIVDARARASLYKGCMLKLNAHTAAELLGEKRNLKERIPGQIACELAERLAHQSGCTVFVTRGEGGLVAAVPGSVYEVPGIQIIEKIDPVGAGDTAVAALAAALGAGIDVQTAAQFANIAGSITVRKLQATGTASPDEILAVGPDPDYVYLPELSDDARGARYVGTTEIEIVRELPHGICIRHAIFDHDGTLSVLREGWEQIMEPMMIRAILGLRYQDADQTLYYKVVDAVRQVIERTTGIQTLIQMQHLIGLVKQFGCVPEDQILDIHGYKAIYNEALLEMVNKRVAKLQRGELTPADFQIKNALQLLERLRTGGVHLYLASGTDEADVTAEAVAMGYADLFEGRIFGAVGDVRVEAKREVLKRIIRENNLKGPEVVTFGDGPVEMRLTKQCGGICVGVASDELRRFGLNSVKRTRLIRGGADLIIPDYSQLDDLLMLLCIENSPGFARTPKGQLDQ